MATLIRLTPFFKLLLALLLLLLALWSASRLIIDYINDFFSSGLCVPLTIASISFYWTSYGFLEGSALLFVWSYDGYSYGVYFVGVCIKLLLGLAAFWLVSKTICSISRNF